MKDHSMSSFSWAPHSMYACCRRSGVGCAASECTARNSGSRRLSLARSFTCRLRKRLLENPACSARKHASKL